MKRIGKIFSVLLTLGILTAMLCSCQQNGNSNNALILRLADAQKQDYPTSRACADFAELVEEKSNGTIKVICHFEEALGDEVSTIEQLELGGIDFVRTSISGLTKYDPSLNVLLLPYIFRDEEHMWKVLRGETGNALLNSATLYEHGISGLTWFTAGSRSFYFSSEIKSIDDLKGLKIRTQENSQVVQDMVKALGAEPVPLSYGKVYSAFVTGEIDGAENSIPSYVSTNHCNVAKYFVTDKHMYIPELLVMSAKTFEGLSVSQRELIKECAVEATEKEIEYWNEYEVEALKKAENAGCHITELSEQESEHFKNVLSAVRDKYSKDYEDILKDILNTD